MTEIKENNLPIPTGENGRNKKLGEELKLNLQDIFGIKINDELAEKIVELMSKVKAADEKMPEMVKEYYKKPVPEMLGKIESFLEGEMIEKGELEFALTFLGHQTNDEEIKEFINSLKQKFC